MENTEEDILQITEKLIRFVAKKDQEEFQNILAEIIEKEQNRAFMEGYRYAVKILEEGLVKKTGEHE